MRGLAFNMFNALGSMIISDNFSIIKKMTQKDKIAISKLGVRIGAKFFYMVNNLKKAPMELSAKLWRAFYLTDIKEAYPLPKMAVFLLLLIILCQSIIGHPLDIIV